jgi:hypothetical protein
MKGALMRVVAGLIVGALLAGEAAAQHAPDAVAQLFIEHCFSHRAADVREAAYERRLYGLRDNEMGDLPSASELDGKSQLSGYRLVAQGGGQVVLGIASFPYSTTAPRAACALHWFASADVSPVAALKAAMFNEGTATETGHVWTNSAGWMRITLRQDTKPNGTFFTLVAYDR